MSVLTFENREADYFYWLKRHPSGFVLNTKSGKSPEYMVLHRASCSLITAYLGKAADGAFTERSFRKICAETLLPIKTWVAENGGKLSICSRCNPDVDESLTELREANVLLTMDIVASLVE